MPSPPRASDPDSQTVALGAGDPKTAEEPNVEEAVSVFAQSDAGTPDNVAPPSSSQDDPLVGQLVCERYRVEERLGSGGMGAVYRAVHVHMRKSVALKVLHRQMTAVPEAVARFEREAIAAGRVTHPNVATATDFGKLDDDSYYLALEYVEGRSLRSVLRESGRMPAVRALSITRQIAEALQAAHAEGIVHRDLKPENVMLQVGDHGEDLVKVLDFGLAKVHMGDDAASRASDPSQLTRVGTVFGTPSYMSPEQASGGKMDHRTDLYSLGIMLYEMLTGSPPFKASSIVVMLNKQINEQPPALPRTIDGRVARLVRCLLSKAPEDRPQSAAQVLDELNLLPKSLQSRGAIRREAGGMGWVRRQVESTRGWWLYIFVPALRQRLDELERRVPQLRVLERSVKVAGRAVPIGALAVAAVALMIVGALVVMLVVAEPREPTKAELPKGPEQLVFVEEGASKRPAEPLTDDQRDRLEELVEMKAAKRSVEDWLELARLHALDGDWSAATSAYRNTVQLDKDQADNPRLLGAVRVAAERRESYEAAINLATTLLGEPGIDLLFDLWMKSKDDPKQRLITEFAYNRMEISYLRRASKALRIRLDLEFVKADDCDAVKKILERAIRYADTRSVDALEALEAKTGCGPGKKRDCYPCIRGNEDLKVALQVAREHPAPKFVSEGYAP